ncbi:MAG: hypothetical protein GY942_21645 [Aestuariibacter sp.]|nr:hypothetical protein [Aestuariibacter sp.]
MTANHDLNRNGLLIEQTYRVLLADTNSFRILLVGVGGTGSALALALAGLIYHARQKDILVELTLVDHDVIQEVNVGRQSFSVGSALAGGVPKCVDLAARLNAAYGLNLVAWPERYTAVLGKRWFSGRAERQHQTHLLIDCVDNHRPRQEMAQTLNAYDGRMWLLSCGNERTNGQVLIGDTNHANKIRFDKLGLCTGLPSPYRQEPGLLEPDEGETVVSCAALNQQEAQSLMINRLVAAVAAQFVTEMVLQRQVTQLGAYFNLCPMVMRSQMVTQEAVKAVIEQV